MAGGKGATNMIRDYDIFNVLQQHFPLLLCLCELLVEDIRMKLQQQQLVCFIFTI